MTEPQRDGAAPKDKPAPATRGISLPSKKFSLFVGGALLTAVLGWSVNYYLPGILSHHSQPPAIAADVNDNPSLIDTFASASETIFLPPSIQKRHVANPPFGFCDQFRVWATGLGGIDAGRTEFRLIVQGNSAQPVVLDGMSAKIIRREPEQRVIPVECETAGNATVRSIRINLDAVPPLANYRSALGTKPFAFTLNKGDTEIFDISASSRTPGTVTFWDLELHAVIDGHGHTYLIEDRGHPFETAGLRKAPTGKAYSWGTTWTPNSPF